MKRSKGVTFFAAYFIMSAAMSLYQSLAGFKMLDWQGYYSLVMSMALLIIATSLFQMKEWSRKGIIYYNIVSTMIGIALVPIILNKIADDPAMNSNKISADSYRQTLQLGMILADVIMVALTAGVIYFFTRPAVKGQFKPEEATEERSGTEQ